MPYHGTSCTGMQTMWLWQHKIKVNWFKSLLDERMVLQSYESEYELERGPMPNVMVALPNRGGALCSTPQSLADVYYQMPCSNAAKTRNPLKLPGTPQTTGSMSAASGPKFAILWGHVEDILLLNKFFSDCRYVPELRRYSPTKLCDGA